MKIVAVSDTHTRELLLKRHQKNNATGCWNFTGCVVRNGYGQLRLNGSRIYAHRLSFQVFKRPIPEGMFVLHTCDNRKCINPNHLWLGDIKANSQDMVKKGRRADTCGERCPTSKLKEKDVLAIRASSLTGRELAKKYKVSPSTISSIRTRTNWSYLP